MKADFDASDPFLEKEGDLSGRISSSAGPDADVGDPDAEEDAHLQDYDPAKSRGHVHVQATPNTPGDQLLQQRESFRQHPENPEESGTGIIELHPRGMADTHVWRTNPETQEQRMVTKSSRLYAFHHGRLHDTKSEAVLANL